ncbi:uncharacterized protein [Amphiura filiformis]|uniref:uncharacterized protein n=1 Tax=Amphiura filiformis TaxID=82378 RepID=UPI003B223E8E
MEENAVESPVMNGDNEDQTPVEEEMMTTTVLKGDAGRINMPGSDEGDSEDTPTTTDATPAPPAFNVDDLPAPADDDDDDVDPELEALANQKEESNNTLELPNVRIIVTRTHQVIALNQVHFYWQMY